MCDIYYYNHQPENWTMRDYQSGKHTEKGTANWGGGCACQLLLAAYTITFLCLLHVDKMLKIQVHDIQFSGKDESDHILISLFFCKTHQCGGLQSQIFPHLLTDSHIWLYADILPFVLYILLKQDAHLCTVQALSAWIGASGITQEFFFCKITLEDWISDNNAPIVTSLVFVCQ